MTLLRGRDSKRLHVKSRLMGESPVGKSFLEGLEAAGQIRLFPDVNVVKIGGQSICDRGASALPRSARKIDLVFKDSVRPRLVCGLASEITTARA